MIWFMPESPRWLMMKDKHDKALHVLAKYHAEGDIEDEFIQLEYAEIRAAIDADRESGQTRWVDFLKTKGNRKRIGIITAIGFFSQWSGNGLISYYLKQVMDNVGITNPQTHLGINAGMKSQALIENITLSFYIDKFGRRPIYLVSTIGTLVTFTIWTIISARYEIAPAKGLGYGFVFMIFCYGLCYDFKYVLPQQLLIGTMLTRCFQIWSHGKLHHRDLAIRASSEGLHLAELLCLRCSLLQPVHQCYRLGRTPLEILPLLLRVSCL
jgi:hypothetical protein